MVKISIYKIFILVLLGLGSSFVYAGPSLVQGNSWSLAFTNLEVGYRLEVRKVRSLQSSVVSFICFMVDSYSLTGQPERVPIGCPGNNYKRDSLSGWPQVFSSQIQEVQEKISFVQVSKMRSGVELECESAVYINEYPRYTRFTCPSFDKENTQ